jgi:hypothetical protein
MDFIRKPILFRTHNELSTADTLPKNTTRAGLSPTLASPRGTQKKTVLTSNFTDFVTRRLEEERYDLNQIKKCLCCERTRSEKCDLSDAACAYDAS